MVITVTCSSCSSSFPVDPAKIPEGGVNARCSSCGNVFRVEKPVEVDPLPTIEEVRPAAPPAPRTGASDAGSGESSAPAVALEEGWVNEGVAAAAVERASADLEGQESDGTEVGRSPDREEPGPAVSQEDAAAGHEEDVAASEGWTKPSGAGAGDVLDRQGEAEAQDGADDVVVADVDPGDDWVVEHEEVPAMEPDPLPPIDDRLPEIPDQADGDSFEPFDRASPFEESMELKVDPMEVEVEFQAPGAEREATDSEAATEDEASHTSDAISADVGMDAPQEAVHEADSAVVDEVEAVVDEAEAVADEAEVVADEVEAVVAEAEAVMEEAEAVAEPAADEDQAAPESETVETPEAGGTEEVEESAPVQGFTFGKRDPTDKARRLARVLVSDMIMYNAERHQSALAAGTLVQDFEEEIDKSWKEYVEQVGAEMANGEGRGYWTRALNDILAKGDEVF